MEYNLVAYVRPKKARCGHFPMNFKVDKTGDWKKEWYEKYGDEWDLMFFVEDKPQEDNLQFTINCGI